MSTNTGFAPTIPMASVVATNVNATVITSSPGPISIIYADKICHFLFKSLVMLAQNV